MSGQNEIVLYQPDEQVKLEVRTDGDTVWLTQQQMTILFETTKQNVSLHIGNIFKEGELQPDSTVKEYLTVQNEGGRTIKRTQKYYNLDVIISVGYRVKSLRGTQFRIWANKILKEYLLRGYAVNQRLTNIENQLERHQNILAEHTGKIDFFVRTSMPPVEGIFYDGNMLEPFGFVNGLIRSAKKRIVLIDNYVDETVLLRLAERHTGVKADIYTRNSAPSFNVALAQHNAQYEQIDVHVFTKAHDRFLIIDDDVYHIGASIKDLGKKWFAFSKMQLLATEIINKL